MRWFWTRPLYRPRPMPPPKTPASAAVLAAWFGGAAVVGCGFGLLAGREQAVFRFDTNALVMLFAAGCVLLVALRFALRRPLTDIFTERQLVAGCGFALTAFVAGNWIAAHGAVPALLR